MKTAIFATIGVIVLVILILPALLPVCGGHGKMAKSIGVCTAFEVAVNNFESEYDYLPFGQSMNDPKTDLAFRSDSHFMAVLAGNETEINYKEIKFFEQYPPKGTDPSNYRDGMYIDEEKVVLYDPWGNLYYIIVDYDEDGRIQHPYKKGEVIRGKKVVIYSAGPDGEIGTEKQNRDNPSNFD